MQDQVEVLNKHIDFLKSLDTEEYYNKTEDEIQRYAYDAIQVCIQLGFQATHELVKLLETEFTWSCFFALKILRETKDPNAIPAIINFLKKDTDDSMANEQAMFVLQDIGTPSIILLIENLEETFDDKKYNSYLVGALTGIIGPIPYDFMIKITKDFINKPWRYKGWFKIEDFIYNFVKQGRSDAITSLQKILEMKSISWIQKQEIEDTIRALKNPENYKKEIQETTKEIFEITQNLDV